MYHARDRRTGKIVAAGSATPYGDYRCPTCKADVFLRSGQYRAKHFAHMPNQGKPECDWFHPSDDVTPIWSSPSPRIAGPAVDPIELSIELGDVSQTRDGRRNWVLRLTLPKSHDGIGEIMMDFGEGDHRRVSLANLLLAGRTYTIDPAAPDFGAIWISATVSPGYRGAIEHRVPGLSRRLPNVFSLSRQKRKPRTNVVAWGESFYLVWSPDRPFALPPNLPDHPFADNRGWFCSLVSLPDKPNAEIAAWFEETCEVKIASSRRAWALAFPPPYALDDDGALKIPPTPHVFLVMRPIMEGDRPASEITCNAGAAASTLALAAQERHVVEIALPTGRAASDRMYFAWDGSPLSTLASASYPTLDGEPKVEFEYSEGGARLRGHLHHANAQSLLASLRARGTQLSDLRGPQGLVGELRRRSSIRHEWESLPLSFDADLLTGGQSPLAAAQLDHVNDALLDGSSDIVLDFGFFGRFTSAGVERVIAQERPVALNAALRRRIAWLLKTAGNFSVKPGITVEMADTAMLVDAITRMTPPSALIAHHRSIRRELQSYWDAA
jgi:hypothetical protein